MGDNVFGDEGIDMDRLFSMDSLKDFGDSFSNLLNDFDWFGIDFKWEAPSLKVPELPPVEFPKIDVGDFMDGLTKGFPDIDLHTFLFGNSPNGVLSAFSDIVLAPADIIMGILDPIFSGISLNPSDIVDNIFSQFSFDSSAFDGVDVSKPISAIVTQFTDDLTAGAFTFDFDIMTIGTHLEEAIAAILDLMFGWIHSGLPEGMGQIATGIADKLKEGLNWVAQQFSNLLGSLFSAMGMPEGLDFADLSVGVLVDIFGATGGINAAAKNLIEFNILPGLLRGTAFSVEGPTGIITKTIGDMGEVVGSTEITLPENPFPFQEGGVLKGPSHSQGGIKAIVGGKRPIEMEGGEYVINKDTVSALGVPFFDFLNSQKKTDVEGQPTKYKPGGKVIPDMAQASKDIFNISAVTTGDVRRILGHHGIEGALGFKNAIPFGAFDIFDGGGSAQAYRETGLDGSRRVHEALHIKGSNGLGEAGFRAGTVQTGLGMMPFAHPYVRLKDWKDWSFFEQGGYANNDPEVANLLAELIQAVKDKEMGVNIFNETGQNMRVSDGEGAGFNESSYRESSSLA